MSQVFVLDRDRQPLDPCHPARARELLRDGRASVFRRFPFTLILQDRTRVESVVHEHRLKIDPGSQTTGLALLAGARVLWAAELSHRGQRITAASASPRPCAVGTPSGVVAGNARRATGSHVSSTAGGLSAGCLPRSAAGSPTS